MDYSAIVKDARQRQEKLRNEMSQLDDMIRSASALAAMQDFSSVQLSPPTRPRVPASRPSPIMNPTREAAARHLRAADGPLATKDLVEKLLADGVPVGGKDPVATLSARLSNAEEFTNIRGVGWWFEGEDFPRPNLSGSIFDEAEGNVFD